MSERIWQASEARANFSDVIDGALDGVPQVIRKRGGEEVVVVSRKDYEAMRPNLKSFLLGSIGAAGDGPDPLDDALRDLRAAGGGFVPRFVEERE